MLCCSWGVAGAGGADFHTVHAGAIVSRLETECGPCLFDTHNRTPYISLIVHPQPPCSDPSTRRRRRCRLRCRARKQKPTSGSSCRTGTGAARLYGDAAARSDRAAGAAFPWRHLRLRRPGQRALRGPAAGRGRRGGGVAGLSAGARGIRSRTPIEVGFAALDWLYKQRAKLAGKGAQVFLAGEEAGGNLAAAVALMARDRAHPPLAGPDPAVADAGPLRRHRVAARGQRATRPSASGPRAGRNT